MPYYLYSKGSDSDCSLASEKILSDCPTFAEGKDCDPELHKPVVLAKL